MTVARGRVAPGAGFLPWVVLACSLLLLIAGARHIVRHPLPIGWDESVYVNHVAEDRHAILRGGPLAWAKQIAWSDRIRPPGYRLAAAPLSLLGEPTPRRLRVAALASLVLTGALLFLAGRLVAGAAAGALWGAGFAFAASPFRADLLFGTEITLYPALAGVVYAVARWFRSGRVGPGAAIVLGGSTAIGALSKATFLVVLVPFLALAALFAWRQPGGRRASGLAAAATFAGLLVAAPWWVYNGGEALRYASNSAGFTPHSFPWVPALMDDLLGPPLAVCVLGALMLAVLRLPWRPGSTDQVATSLAVACAGGAIMLAVLHALSINHNMRLLSPAWVPAAGVPAILLHGGGWLGRRSVQTGVSAALVAQSGLLAVGAWNARPDQWDWEPLRQAVAGRGISAPLILQLGLAPAMNPAQIEYPWIRRGERIDARFAWRPEQPPIDWDRVDRLIGSAAVVLTAIGLPGDESPLDNRHNEALIARLLSRPDWTVDTLRLAGSGGPAVVAFVRQPKGR